MIEHQWMCNKIQKEKRKVYLKKNQLTIQSFNQHSFSKNSHMILLGNDVKQMEPLRDVMDLKEEEKKRKEKKKWKRE